LATMDYHYETMGRILSHLVNLGLSRVDLGPAAGPARLRRVRTVEAFLTAKPQYPRTTHSEVPSEWSLRNRPAGTRWHDTTTGDATIA
jgi:hypothetical protein